MSNQIYFDAMKAKGLADAADLQERSSSLDGTALYAEEDMIAVEGNTVYHVIPHYAEGEAESVLDKLRRIMAGNLEATE